MKPLTPSEQRRDVIFVGFVEHRRPTKKNPQATVPVTIFYAPVQAQGKYTGERLRAIRADGKHR